MNTFPCATFVVLDKEKDSLSHLKQQLDTYDASISAPLQFDASASAWGICGKDLKCRMEKRHPEITLNGRNTITLLAGSTPSA